VQHPAERADLANNRAGVKVVVAEHSKPVAVRDQAG
jgi:hypothetical protein